MDYIILGTDHRLQNADGRDVGLRDLLQDIIDKHNVVLIAEEVPTTEGKIFRTFGQDLVGKDKWLSIDMNTEERKDAQIYDILRSGVGPAYDPATGCDVRANPYHKKSEGIREKFWLNRIDRWCENFKVSAGTIVITCGHNHLDFLAEKIAMQGHTVAKLEYLLCKDKQSEYGIFTIFDD